MTKLQVQSDANENALDIIKAAIAAEVKRLEIGLHKTNRQIKKFEKRYGVTSDRFQKELAGEDMKKGDEEYIRWAGELQIRTRIETDLKHLKDIEFVAA
jgi:hypothetical protein